MINQRLSDIKMEHNRVKFCERNEMDMQANREKINIKFNSGTEKAVCVFS